MNARARKGKVKVKVKVKVGGIRKKRNWRGGRWNELIGKCKSKRGMME